MLFHSLTALLAFSVAQQTTAGQPPADLAVFVGRFVDIRELPNVCEGKDCISLDARYGATYEVLKTLRGSISNKTISFEVFDHYGLPDFTRYEISLLFVEQSKDGNYLQKYHGFAVDPTIDGSWGYCGPFSFGKVKVEIKDLQDIDFVPGVVFGAVGSLNNRAIREQYNPSIYEVKNGLVYCRKGLKAEKLVALFLGARE
jgi:hypothetical protein